MILVKDTKPDDIVIGGYYRHFKSGHVYRVRTVAKNAADLADIVVYEAQYENPHGIFWTRPLSEFMAEVYWKGKTVKRFEPVEKPK